MGPQASKSYPGQRLVKPVGPKPERAKQEIDYGRRGIAGYVFGALQPATGEAFTLTYSYCVINSASVSWVARPWHAAADSTGIVAGGGPRQP
jgi:hypothetical protein